MGACTCVHAFEHKRAQLDEAASSRLLRPQTQELRDSRLPGLILHFLRHIQQRTSALPYAHASTSTQTYNMAHLPHRHFLRGQLAVNNRHVVLVVAVVALHRVFLAALACACCLAARRAAALCSPRLLHVSYDHKSCEHELHAVLFPHIVPRPCGLVASARRPVTNSTVMLAACASHARTMPVDMLCIPQTRWPA